MAQKKQTKPPTKNKGPEITLTEETGPKLKDLTPEELQKIGQAIKKAFRDLEQQYGKNVVELIEELREIDEAREELGQQIIDANPDKYGNVTFAELQKAAETFKDAEALFLQLLDEIEEAEAAGPGDQKELKELERIITKRPDKIIWPLDKLNSPAAKSPGIWYRDFLKGSDRNQVTLSYNVARQGKAPLNVRCTLLFDDELVKNHPELKKLTPFDKRVYFAVSALYEAQERIVTMEQIWEAMGGKSSPGNSNREKIQNSLAKMASVFLYLDNEEEARAYKNVNLVIVDWQILLYTRPENKEYIINGKKTAEAFKLLDEPALNPFLYNRHAEGKRQLTNVSLELLEYPLKRDDSNLILGDYLLTFCKRGQREAEKPRGAKSKKVELETIYQACNITTRMQKSRAKEKIRTLMNHFKKYAAETGLKSYMLTDAYLRANFLG